MTRGVALMALAVLLAGCSGGAEDPVPPAPSGDAGADDPAAPFTLDADGCRELLLMTSVPQEQARAFVPDSYTLLGAASGTATAFVTLKHCDRVEVDGVPYGPASTGDMGVYIDRGQPGVFHYYQVAWTTDHLDLLARLKAQSWPARLSQDDLTFTPGPATATARATVEALDSAYDLAADLAVAAATGTNRAVGWHDAADGPITVDKLLVSASLGSGTGTIQARGDAARLLGGEATGIALWNAYDLRGNVGAADAAGA